MVITEIIKNENPHCPLTDEEVAQKLLISRVAVTKLRKKFQIADSRARKRMYMINDLKAILNENSSLSDRQIAKRLQKLGYDTTRYLVAQLKKKVQPKSKIAAISSKNSANIEENNVFHSLIGHDGSLKLCVDQAKAALLYPPHGLHTLLIGNSGVGKSYLAEKMYQFALTTDNFNDDAPFLAFNCADYADNPQLLLGQLFGYQKGAFTGAVSDKKGVVELCNGGILFLDEIHRLPEEGQEILFQLLDKGHFRRMGAAGDTRTSRIMLIGATTEKPENSLLLTFRRRIPMSITIPSYTERPIQEREELVHSFFQREGLRLKRNLIISQDVFNTFVSYSYPGNVGQLKNDIKVCCAKALLQAVTHHADSVRITFQHMTEQIRNDVLNGQIAFEENSCGSDLQIQYNNQMKPNDVASSQQEDIYQYIENMHMNLKYEGYDDDRIIKLLGGLVEKKLAYIARSTRSNRPQISSQTIADIVGKRFMTLADYCFEQAKKKLPLLRQSVIYPLASHMKSAYERIIAGKRVKYPDFDKVKKEHEKEYFIAKELTQTLAKKLEITIPDDEAGFIAIYLCHFQISYQKKHEKNIGVVILSHGHVASGMAEVVNQLLGIKQAIGVDMALSDSPNFMLEKTIIAVKKANQGKGCILLADMGSLLSFGPIIQSRTQIPVKVIGRVDTLMAMECVRKSMIPEYTLENLLLDTKLQKNTESVSLLPQTADNQKQPAILTLCLTGKRSAIKIKDYLHSLNFPELNAVHVIPVGLVSCSGIEAIVKHYQISYYVAAIVGTVNPQLADVAFLSMEELMRPAGKLKLKRLLHIALPNNNQLHEVIDERFILFDSDSMTKEAVIDRMVATLLKNKRVSEGFSLSVYKRETYGDTLLKGGIAIPHGNPSFVTKPTIVVTKLDHDISWTNNQTCHLVFLLALNEDSRPYFEQLYSLISDQSKMEKLQILNDRETIKQLLLN
ncbi:sigma 54-interacting transcriptional regulator [Sporolactobacillus shoreicorticis]|uniref:Sigma 54-interacting transcriptional regulator n=1 Tax=Sporolactobacillus shoreicorticis TaxID=1923877 RepID=A0ABW5S117_9BACL|nr:sigma 54-interacting transcriptional regulator [Sporolactobacillus shoreicorticis]MCO7125354.1 sigma 54-interacting transcriptional regulator [Sporolactobacillus shoreicorticis]